MTARARISVVPRVPFHVHSRQKVHLTSESRRLAGVLFIALPTVLILGAGYLTSHVGTWEYARNPLRQDLWRAAYAHAGVLSILALVALRYVDEARLPEGWREVVRKSIPAAAFIIPAALFLSVLAPDVRQPSAIINLVYIGAALLFTGVVTLGIGLVRAASGRYPVQVHFEADEPVPNSRALALPAQVEARR